MDYFQPSLKFTDFGTMTKTNYNRNPSSQTFKEQVAVSGGWLNTKYKSEMFQHPRYETANNYYVGNNKKVKVPVPISNAREGHLQNVRWTDRMFTGDDVKSTAVKTYFARKRD